MDGVVMSAPVVEPGTFVESACAETRNRKIVWNNPDSLSSYDCLPTRVQTTAPQTNQNETHPDPRVHHHCGLYTQQLRHQTRHLLRRRCTWSGQGLLRHQNCMSCRLHETLLREKELIRIV